MPKPAAKLPSTAQKKDQKKKQAFQKVKEALSAGESASTVTPDEPASPCPTPEPVAVDVPPTLPEQNKVELKKLIKRMKTLEHQLEIAFEHSQFAVPQEILDGLSRLEDCYGKFRSNVRISISGAVECQDAYSELLCLCFGDRTAILYKLLRRNLHKEYKHLTREEKANKTLKQDSPVLVELRTVSQLIHDLVNERNSPGTWALSFRDATRLTVDRCFFGMFVNLRDILEAPYSTEIAPAEFRALIRRLEKDTRFLFGSTTPGAMKLEALCKAFEEEAPLSKQKAFLFARELFPFKKEVHSKERA